MINNSGLKSVLMMARYHGIAADEIKLTHEFGRNPFTSETILLAAKHLGMTAKLVEQEPDRLDRSPMPAIAIDKEGNYFIAVKFGYEQGDKTKPKIAVQQPANPETVLMDLAEFLELWSGKLIFFTSKVNYLRELGKFDFSWFIPSIVKYRRLFGEVVFLSFIIQLLGLATPMAFQVVMDKVLVNNAMMTLNVVAIGLFSATIFENVLTGIRTWVFAQTTSKIDVELGARLFRHLLALPTAYFQARRVGDSVARVRELENVRAFLTGNAVTLVMDMVFSYAYFFVMLWYSFQLSMIVLCSIPIYIALSFIITPILRDRLKDKFNHFAGNYSFLVESISGIDTVKSMAVEPRWVDIWEKQLAGYVAASMRSTSVETIATMSVTMVNKLTTVAILWIGASLVIDAKLSLGQLIAFNMISGRFTDPILRIAGLWNSFQQVGVSVERMGDILNAPTEIEGNKTRIPRLDGSIEFDQVSFRYSPESPDVLRSISVKIAPGEVIGIVGRSGSGKSTLTRLVQRLYTPAQGRVMIDGQDIAIIDTTSLRHQLGVVLQENVLFTGTIKDNVALSNPALPIETIIAATKLAGAHEFICELPEGYDTKVGEHGAGLSGGQRQRIAIARALITNPRILIFDEATSALDYESEKIIQENMRKICEGRTVLIIAHRLSAVRDANRILVMERGQIVEDGSHDQLLEKRGIYEHLYQLQFSGTTAPSVVK
jgi:subfamily B ATP-binding cassette protein HlyB/CyaB